MTKRESVRKGEISITEVDNQLKKLGGADKKIEYLENILQRKNSLSPETLIHVYETALDLYYEKPSTTPEESWKRQIYSTKAESVRYDIKWYKDFDEHKKEWIQKYEETIKQIHEYNPEYIFLTETSSIPLGYLIKEALRKAYPNSPLPKFYRVDPRQIQEVMFEGGSEEKRKLEEFFRKRIKIKNAKILVYDTDWDAGRSPGSIVALLKYPERFGFDIDINCPNVKMNGRIFPEQERKLSPNVKKDFGIDDSDIAPIIGIEFPFRHGMSRLTIKEGNENKFDFRGRRLKKENYPSRDKQDYDPRYRTPLELIEGAKKLGRELGQELRAELEKKESLEQRLSAVIAIAGLGAGLFFFGSSITGNAIGSLSESSSNFLGIVLLAIGLIAGFFWLKNRRNF